MYTLKITPQAQTSEIKLKIYCKRTAREIVEVYSYTFYEKYHINYYQNDIDEYNKTRIIALKNKVYTKSARASRSLEIYSFINDRAKSFFILFICYLLNIKVIRK